jgi:predicted RNase H-like nuclease (RuvC/YqgF family)
VHEIILRGFEMGWMTAIDVLTNQVTDLAVENMKLNGEVERLKSENKRLLSELKKLKKSEELAPLVFESEEQ